MQTEARLCRLRHAYEIDNVEVPQETEDTCGAVLDWCDRNLGFA
jgi:hypothetical protein